MHHSGDLVCCRSLTRSALLVFFGQRALIACNYHAAMGTPIKGTVSDRFRTGGIEEETSHARYLVQC